MRATSITLLLFALLVSIAVADAPSAENILGAAETKAAAEKKAVFVHFGASWCVWCHRLDAYLDRPDVKPVFEKYFVPVKLDMGEKGDQKALENAGADKMAKDLGGPGFPFWAFLDAKGGLIANSNAKGPGSNVGYPGAPAEIEWFAKTIKQAAPKISEAELQTLVTPLKTPPPVKG
jgi:thioredoxin-related protein